jgi:hypothetical protein
MMLVFLMWAHADRVGTASRGWLETVRTACFETLVTPPAAARSAPGPGSGPQAGAGPEAAPAAAAGAAPEPAVAGARGTIDDDEHLDAYNAYLARLNQPGHRPGR